MLTNLKHSQEQMLFTTFILISVYREHNCLKQRINLGHCDKTAEMSNVSWFGLEEEEKIAVFLRLLVVWKETLL